MANVFKGTEFIFIKGKLSWVRVVNPNQFGDWSSTIHPDAESLEVIRELQAEGLMNKLKKDGDGYFIQFKCPLKKEFKGVVKSFSPPTVVDADGQPFDGTKIGNGSDGYLKLEVYRYKPKTGGTGVAARLVGVRVDNLVPFEPSRDASSEDAKSMEDLKALPPMLF